MPSPRKTSPSPSLSDSTSRANDRSMCLLVRPRLAGRSLILSILGSSGYAVDTVIGISIIDAIYIDAPRMNVGDIDLNLLKIFDAVNAEGSVSRAAQRIGLTQPSVSHGLARLRAVFGDALFVRVRGGVAPTPVARRIAPALTEALRAVQSVLDDAERFDPATDGRVFRIHMSDLGEMVFLPPLMRALRDRAPGVSLETRQIEPAALPAALDGGTIDMAIGHLPRTARRVRASPSVPRGIRDRAAPAARRRRRDQAPSARRPTTSRSRRIRRRSRSCARAASSIA